MAVDPFISAALHKSVAKPLKQIGRRELLHGFVDEYRDVIEDVILLEGETHNERPSVSTPTHSLCPHVMAGLPSRVIFVLHPNWLGRNILIQSYMSYCPFRRLSWLPNGSLTICSN